MTTKNLVPRLDGQGKLGVKGASNLKWKEVNAVSGSFDLAQIDDLQNQDGNDLIVGGTGITVTHASGSSGFEYTISASSTATTLSSLTDVSITSAADNDLIYYNNSTSSWENINKIDFLYPDSVNYQSTTSSTVTVTASDFNNNKHFSLNSSASEIIFDLPDASTVNYGQKVSFFTSTVAKDANVRIRNSSSTFTDFIHTSEPATTVTSSIVIKPNGNLVTVTLLNNGVSGQYIWFVDESASQQIRNYNSSVSVSDTGTNGTIDFVTDGVDRWEINNSGHLLPASNSDYDIGSAELKVRHLFLSDTSLRFGGASTTTAPYYLSVDTANDKFRVSVDGGSAWENIALASEIPSLTGYATETFVNTTVNDALQGLDAKEAVDAATTGVLSGYTYASNVFTETTASGALTIDGFALSNGDRVLVKDQGSGNEDEHGIYVVSNADGSPSSSVTLTRASDLTHADTDADDFDGAFVFVLNGTELSGRSYVAKPTTSGETTVGTHGMTWVTFTSSATSDLNSLTDVAITSVDTSHIIKYNGSTWVNSVLHDTNLMPNVKATHSAQITNISGGSYPDNRNRLLITSTTSPHDGGYFDPSTTKLIIDGVSLDIGDIFLVKDGASLGSYNSESWNGFWTIVSFPNNSYAFCERYSDTNYKTLRGGNFAFIEEGTVNAGKGFVCTNSGVVTAGNQVYFSEIATGATGIQNVVEDTTPQLGGDLDLNGNKFVTTSNAALSLAPNGTGVVTIEGNATGGSGALKLNCENNSHGVTIKGPPHSAAATYTLTLPNTDGNANQVLKTDGSGVLDWVDQSSGGATTLDELTDVDTSTVAPTDGQVLAWNNTASEWQPSNRGQISSYLDQTSVSSTTSQSPHVTNVTAANFNDHDIFHIYTTTSTGYITINLPALSTLNIGDKIEYSVAQSNWNLSIVGHATDSNEIMYSSTRGAAYANTGITIKSGTSSINIKVVDATQGKAFYVTEIVPTSIDNLTDVDVTSTLPVDGQVLAWNSTDSEWQPSDVVVPEKTLFITTYSSIHYITLSDLTNYDNWIYAVPAASVPAGETVRIDLVDPASLVPNSGDTVSINISRHLTEGGFNINCGITNILRPRRLNSDLALLNSIYVESGEFIKLTAVNNNGTVQWYVEDDTTQWTYTEINSTLSIGQLQYQPGRLYDISTAFNIGLLNDTFRKGKPVLFRNSDASNSSTISAGGSRTIEGSSSFSLKAGKHIEMLPDSTGSNMHILNKLNRLVDVGTAAPADGQALAWSSSASEWQPTTISGGASTLGGLSDVTLTSPSDNSVLTYDNGSSSWIDGQSLSLTGNIITTANVQADELQFVNTNNKLYMNQFANNIGTDLDSAQASAVLLVDKPLIVRPMSDNTLTILGRGANESGGGGTGIRFYDNGDSNGLNRNYIKIKVPDAKLDASYTLTLPANDGTANQVLETDGNGGLSWVTPAGGGSVPNVTSASPSSAYTITTHAGIEEIYLLTPSADVTATIPSAAAAGSGYKYNIKNLSATYTLTVKAPTSPQETIDGQGTFDLSTQYSSITIVSDGSNWHII